MNMILKSVTCCLYLTLLSFVVVWMTPVAVALDNEKSQASLHHDIWNTLLEKHVITHDDGHSTSVNYAGFKKDRAQLAQYLSLLNSVKMAAFDRWSNARQLAFLINAYNAWTIELILTRYPKLESIKELGGFFSSPWRKSFIPLLGETRSLDDIEHELIRGSGRYNDPRIHFAVNCASIGCPALLEMAYTEANLETQLAAQTIRFLTDKNRNYIQDDTLYLSSIFKWYRDDFKQSQKGSASLQSFVLQYADAMKLTLSQIHKLKQNDMDIEFLDYDWRLNAQR